MSIRFRRRTAAVPIALVIALAPLVPGSASSAFTSAPAPDDSTSGWTVIDTPLPSYRGGQPLKTGSAAQQAFRLDAGRLIGALRGAPLENSSGAARPESLPVISIPGVDGRLHEFRFVSSPVMEAPLEAKVAFSSFAGTALDDPAITARFDYSPVLGFHATVSSPRGSYRVDPAYNNDTSTYLAHAGLVKTSADEAAMEQRVSRAAATATASAETPEPGDFAVQRTYRFALANDPGYAAQVGAANVDVVKASIVNRVNQIYNDEAAIKFVLVADNDRLALNTEAEFTGANGPCGVEACFTPTKKDDMSACTPEKRDQAATAITSIIGVDSYDIGQILDPGDNGGIAQIGAVGIDAIKGAGCSGGPNGNSDFLAVEFLAHEMGHQFGATHTFSSKSCGGFSRKTAAEPGSGSTIMSYAGTCDRDDNIQDPSDPYFARVSLDQIQAYITSTIKPSANGGQPAENGGVAVVTSNRAPIVRLKKQHVIPVRTPFTLTGSVSDSTGGTPVSAWEQTDVGGIRPLMSNNKPAGPLFRMFSRAAVAPTYDQVYDAPGLSQAKPSGDTRTFPDLKQIASGNTNAADGTCPTSGNRSRNIECFAEFLPTSPRTMHFALTARDRFISGGGVGVNRATVEVAGSEPFRVTTKKASVKNKTRFAVTWDVAGTTRAPFSVKRVRISYSTDGGRTFERVLKGRTANDGKAKVRIPKGATKKARFKVEALGQPFFDISHRNIKVRS